MWFDIFIMILKILLLTSKVGRYKIIEYRNRATSRRSRLVAAPLKFHAKNDFIDDSKEIILINNTEGDLTD